MEYSIIKDGVLTRVDEMDIVDGCLTITEDVYEIGNTAFFNREGIKKLCIPKTLKNIRGGAMGYFGQLQEIEVDDENPVYSCENGCLTMIGRLGKKIIVCASELGSIAEDIDVVGWCAFKNSSRRTVFIPKSVTSIDSSAFSECKNLETVCFESGASMIIGLGAFENCEKLKEVILPENLYAIEDRAFKGCSSLETIDVPSGVWCIGFNAFENCEKLKRVVIPFGVKLISDDAFKNCPNLKTFVVEYELGKFQEVDRQWLCDQLGIHQNDALYRQKCHKMRMIAKNVATQSGSLANPIASATIMAREPAKKCKKNDDVQR